MYKHKGYLPQDFEKCKNIIAHFLKLKFFTSYQHHFQAILQNYSIYFFIFSLIFHVFLLLRLALVRFFYFSIFSLSPSSSLTSSGESTWSTLIDFFFSLSFQFVIQNETDHQRARVQEFGSAREREREEINSKRRLREQRAKNVE